MSVDRYARVRAAFLGLSDPELRTLVDGLTPEVRHEFFHLLDAATRGRVGPRPLPVEIRRRFDLAPRELRAQLGELLARRCADDTIELLGDRHGDPSVDDMLSVLDEIIERHGLPVVTLMLAAFSAQGYQCQETFDTLLETDGRFVIATADVPSPSPPDEEDPAEREAKREGRRDRRARQRAEKAAAQEREEELMEQLRTRRKEHRSAVRTHPTDVDHVEDAPTAAASTGATETTVVPAARHPVRLVRRYGRGIRQDHRLVGCVVQAEILFHKVPGGKVRPAVVVAGSRWQLVVRPCYSEGGLNARDWRSVPIEHWREAGLDRKSWVGLDEEIVPMHSVGRVVGELTDDDWNQL